MLQGHAGSITSVAFHCSGTLLASGSVDKTLRLWDLDRQKCTTLEVMTLLD